MSEIELRFPSSIYYADPYAAIRSVLGNDVEIKEFKESNIILPDNSILVNVVYSAIDFDLFKLYIPEETKLMSQQSQKVVATKIRDSITGQELDDSKMVVISNYNPKVPKQGMFIKYLDRINFGNSSIKYYGFVPQTKSDVLHSYCSLIDSQFLSYHGSKLKAPEVQISDHGKLNPPVEWEAIQKLALTGIETNNFTNSLLDISVIFKGHSTQSENIECEITPQDKRSGFINFNKYPEETLINSMAGKNGILLMSKYREALGCVLYLDTSESSGNSVVITEDIVKSLLLIIKYDTFNLNLLKN